MQARLLWEIVNLLLMIHLQLLHQLEGVHVSGSGASAWLVVAAGTARQEDAMINILLLFF